MMEVLQLMMSKFYKTNVKITELFYFNVSYRSSVTEKLSGTYTLNIKFEGKTYNLKYQGTKTILEVKGDFYTLTNVHVRNQIWSGWPPNIDDNTMLALSGIK